MQRNVGANRFELFYVAILWPIYVVHMHVNRLYILIGGNVVKTLYKKIKIKKGSMCIFFHQQQALKGKIGIRKEIQRLHTFWNQD